MKIKLNSFLVFSLLFFSACSKNQENNSPSENPSQEKENYINPFEPNGPDPDDHNSQTPDPVDPVIPEKIYDEDNDSLEGIDENDMSGLYGTFDSISNNYTSTLTGYFNEGGSYDYYRHYTKNYVCDKTSFYTNDCQYTLPELETYLGVCNIGYINRNNNYYQFSLNGSSKEERMSSTLTESDLTNEVMDKSYQDDMFTIADLNQTYFESKGFTRISLNKYQCTNKDVCEQFISICATDLINEGFYLTFSRVTIETNPDPNHILRIRLYVQSTQIGKLINSHKDQENKPNWYLLFSEALINNVGTTTFTPADSLLS